MKGTGYHLTRGFFWFRIFGYGLCITTNAPTFSERNGYEKSVRVFGVKFEVLTP